MFYLKALVVEGMLQVMLLFLFRSPSGRQEEQVGDSPFWWFRSFPVNQLDQNSLFFLCAPGKAESDPQSATGMPCAVLSSGNFCCCQLVPTKNPV